MSTIKTTNIGHPSAGSPNLTLAADGGITFNGSVSGGGLDLITTQSFSSASSVSINNCFSNQYLNYKIIVSNISASTLMNFNYRLRSSSIDSSTGYYYASQYAFFASSSSGQNNGNNISQFYGIYTNSTAGSGGMVIEMQNPFATAHTSVQSQQINYDVFLRSGGYHGVSSSYDGITFFASTGTVSGNIHIYGYKIS